MADYQLPERCPDAVPDFVRALPTDGQGKLCIFDADGTLWRDDVADDFARWMMAEGHIEDGGRWSEYVRIYRADAGAGCEHMLTFYRGMTLPTLERYVRAWWQQAERCWVVEALESLLLLAERGYASWVVTGSPTTTMLPLCDFLPVQRIVGMDFALDDSGRITGERSGIRCAHEGKAQKVRQLWGDRPVVFAAGNGPLDTAMLELSEGVVWCVYPGPELLARAREHGWHVLPRPPDFVEEAKLA